MLRTKVVYIVNVINYLANYSLPFPITMLSILFIVVDIPRLNIVKKSIKDENEVCAAN